ncbi:hypothetical protein IFM89_020286 [Coptis chinensis]|uniref:RNase H type-1 domain-containing protein n=1 Tax=Coptis chinensis TaxID=261450 RepID=A0A835I3Y1_9MAGN|nr:hypothetical protein IFM89_020286 [Coptis chinensis]
MGAEPRLRAAPRIRECCWMLPEGNEIEVNIGGESKGNPGRHLGITTNYMTESLAILESVEIAAQRGWHQLWEVLISLEQVCVGSSVWKGEDGYEEIKQTIEDVVNEFAELFEIGEAFVDAIQSNVSEDVVQNDGSEDEDAPRSFKQKQNDKKRYIIYCIGKDHSDQEMVKGCPRKVACSLTTDHHTVNLRKYVGTHTCEADGKNRVVCTSQSSKGCNRS